MTFAVPALSSYSRLKSSTDGFLISSLLGFDTGISGIGGRSNEGIRCTSPGDGVLGLGILGVASVEALLGGLFSNGCTGLARMLDADAFVMVGIGNDAFLVEAAHLGLAKSGFS